ncbi:transportin2-like protein [Trypanosoma grayi]|uniref:transportin2-like protein n=1 Tax=Trypanosoma grayi TaxID=71804 RepID=UPI0004F4A0F7|nr:transportin2-like protein [Trypanosoma grayi]KEG12715.1 transportin2-like protein [Trypanosoma grayi]
MESEQKYNPTTDDVLSVLRLLHDNGISVQNSRKAYEELQQYQANPNFCILLSFVFSAENCPIQTLQPVGSWIQYRRLAGITLKNNLERSEYALGEVAVKEAARGALSVLGNPTDVRIARVAAQIVVKITALTSFDWWQACGMGNLPNLLLNELFRAGELKTLSALYTLQYLVEDLPKEVGAAGKDIIEQVVTLALDQNAHLSMRKAAFRMCSNMYEHAELLDWNVEGLSPLQNGLVGASGTFTGACTAILEQGCGCDIALMIEVLRSCVMMLEYLDYFTPLSDADMARLVHWWIRNTIDLVSSRSITSEYDVQLKTAAMDLLTATLSFYDRVGGEGPICLLVEPILQSLPNLVPVLVQFVPMSQEEINSILSTDDYRMRGATAVNYHISEERKDISEDTFFDEDRGAATLRASTLRCIDALCVFSSEKVFPHLIEQVRILWDGDSQLKEAAIVLIGTMANGCYTEIEQILPTVVEQLISAVTSPSENIFVVSIALWALSRMLEWAYARDDGILSNIVAAFIAQTQNTSRRVQQAAVSSLNTAFITGHNMDALTKLAGSYSGLATAVVACLPNYCDANLSLLCDLALRLIAVSENISAASSIVTVFENNRTERAKSFEKTYVDNYINELPNIHVDKDIFSIDRVIVGYLSRFPNPETSVKFLESWHMTLKDAVERNVSDDTDLLYNIMYTCCNFATTTTSATLAEWASQTQGSLAGLAYHLLVRSPQQTVKSAAVELLIRLLNNIGGAAFPNGMSENLMEKLASSMREVDDPSNKLELVRLITLMVEVYSSEFPSSASAAFSAAVDALRSDAYGDSLLLFARMAFEICRALGVMPNLVRQSRPDVVARIMAQTENTYEKSVATIQLIDALLSAEEVALAMLPDAMRLVYSWQQAACDFPGTQEKLKSLLLFYNSRQGEQLKEHINALNPNFREMLLLAYGMN